MDRGKIFLCYRRDDSAGHAGRVYDRLNQRFPGRVFMDVAGIGIGTRWAEVIETTLGSCQVAVILIGKRWLDVGPDGARRIDKPDDPTRAEIAAALRLNLRVVPVLISGAGVPERNNIPSDIAALADWQAVRIDDEDFDHDTTRLVRALESQLGDQESGPDLESVAARQVQLARLMADAESAVTRADWITAAQTLQSVLSIDRQHAEAASRLRFVQQQSQRAFAPEPDVPLRARGWLSFGIGALRIWITVGIAALGFVVVGVGGMLRTGSAPPQAADPVSANPSSEAPAQPGQIEEGNPEPSGGGVRPGVSPKATGGMPPAAPREAPAPMPPPQPRPAPSLAGEYALVSYSENGTQLPVTGAMELVEVQPGRYQFETVVIHPGLGVTLQYQGLFEGQGSAWAVTTLQTNDPTALVGVPIATQAGFDGSTLRTENTYGQVAFWRKQ